MRYISSIVQLILGHQIHTPFYELKEFKTKFLFIGPNNTSGWTRFKKVFNDPFTISFIRYLTSNVHSNNS